MNTQNSQWPAVTMWFMLALGIALTAVGFFLLVDGLTYGRIEPMTLCVGLTCMIAAAALRILLDIRDSITRSISGQNEDKIGKG